jgi:hypothetical protein
VCVEWMSCKYNKLEKQIMVKYKNVKKPAKNLKTYKNKKNTAVNT